MRHRERKRKLRAFSYQFAFDEDSLAAEIGVDCGRHPPSPGNIFHHSFYAEFKRAIGKDENIFASDIFPSACSSAPVNSFFHFEGADKGKTTWRRFHFPWELFH